MKALTHQLSSPFHFLFFRESKTHTFCVWAVPFALASLSILIAWLLLDIEILRGRTGIIADINDIFLILPGFFIASLAAVATFNRPEMDMQMEDSPTKPYLVGGKIVWLPMSRRLFLSSLFSYLAAVTIVLVVCTKIFTAVPEPVPTYNLFSWTGFFVFCFVAFQIMVSSLIGAYFLSEGAHTA